MSNNLSIFSGGPTLRVFPCPNCKQTINTSVAQCPFCATPIDPATAQAAADEMSRIHDACGDADTISVAGTYVAPVLAIRWWLKFGNLRTDDPDFHRAKKIPLAVLGKCALIILIVIAGIALGVR